MSLKSIRLQWFRGAAESVTLDLGSKSMVIYGENGSGKSSFVDAIEFATNGGKIGHLCHEYSGKKGKKLEKAVPNTHKPTAASTEFSITLKDKTEHRVTIEPEPAR